MKSWESDWTSFRIFSLPSPGNSRRILPESYRLENVHRNEQWTVCRRSLRAGWSPLPGAETGLQRVSSAAAGDQNTRTVAPLCLLLTQLHGEHEQCADMLPAGCLQTFSVTFFCCQLHLLCGSWYLQSSLLTSFMVITSWLALVPLRRCGCFVFCSAHFRPSVSFPLLSVMFCEEVEWLSVSPANWPLTSPLFPVLH